jgi:hypothetical protein
MKREAHGVWGQESNLRALALIYPIERHVGHWACSSPSLDVTRVIMEGANLESKILDAARMARPQFIAVIGKRVGEYNDLLDELSRTESWLGSLPRVYRCQNTVLRHRVEAMPGPASREVLAGLDAWFARACDPRFSLVLVQTLDDVDLIAGALYPTAVAPCPYGYDPAVFDPDLPELERTWDVGCYFNLRDDPRRVNLISEARSICQRRGWTFRFISGKYGGEYADQIRTTKICLHYSDQGEIPFRLYETTTMGSVFVSDPLRCGVDSLFTRGEEYLTFSKDLSDLEDVLGAVLSDKARWERIRTAGKTRARDYTWGHIAEKWVVPALRPLLNPDVESTS